MKVLFGALHFGAFRNFESVVRELARRGHQVHLMADEAETFGGEALVERLAQCPGVTWSWAPPVGAEGWFTVAQKLRHALDYVRFLDRRYAGSPKLRLRAEERAPRAVRWLGALPRGRRWTRTAAERLLRTLDAAMPLSDAALAFLRRQQPDVVLLASLTTSRSPQLDHLKAARALGLPTGACIMSWDHLSSKALLHVPPDRVLVWNEIQRREAIDMHALPAPQVVVTGAQCYDQWFDRQPSRSRDGFMQSLGLDPAQPLLLYVCSAMTPRPQPLEPHFVAEWIAAVRASSDPRLRHAAILVRPHPERVKEWREVDLSAMPGVVVQGGNPIDAAAKADYFDALYHSAAVVGVCTTAFLEAAIVGRPVLALVWPQFEIHQQSMLHYRYLVDVEGGVLREARTFDEHRRQLLEALAYDAATDQRRARFLTAFIRPQGLDVAATPVMADAIEALAAIGPRPVTAPPAPTMAAAVARRLVAAVPSPVAHWALMDEIEIDRLRREDDQADTKQRRRRARARSPKKQIARLKTQVKRVLHLS